MDSSSDGSFLWTDASDDSLENENMAKTNKNTKQSGDESESGKTYKKKLQQRLFSGSQEEGVSTVDIPTHGKRKRSLTQTNSDNETFHKSPKKKRIKTEPESDIDVSKVHKKNKSLESTKSASNDSYDEDYLDSKVKDEQNFVVPSAVKNRKSRNKDKSSVTDISLNNEYYDLSCSENQTEKQTEGLHYEDESSHIEEESRHLEEDGSRSKKKKKSKKKRKQSESEATGHENSIHESICAEESVIEQPEESQQNHHSNKTTTGDDAEPTPNGHITPTKQINSSNTSYRSIRKKASISERLTFEDEDSDGQTESVTVKPTSTKKTSKKLNAFVESSETLRPILSKLPEAMVLSEDDDIWVIRCPKDVSVEAFQDKKWTLDSKCKIKLNEKTYEGCLEDEKRYMTIMSAENDRRIIKNLLITGSVRLRRRIPKAHIHNTNTMVNNHDFIPLPDTKCRHPLFGSNYRKAIKLPSAVRERLQAAQQQSLSVDKKKKKKKRKSEQIEETLSTPKQEHAADAELTELAETITSKKKKKKRRYTVTEEESTPRKKIKHNPESVEAWESEKAIEENLFNF